jgi:DNA-binding GntR family transcriptional regulator
VRASCDSADYRLWRPVPDHTTLILAQWLSGDGMGNTIVDDALLMRWIEAHRRFVQASQDGDASAARAAVEPFAREGIDPVVRNDAKDPPWSATSVVVLRSEPLP